MNNTVWLIVGDFGHINGMAATARKVAEAVKMVVVGPRALAEEAAKADVDELCWYSAGIEAPAESFASAIAEKIVADQPRAVLALDDAVSRTLWAKTAVALKAACVGTLTALETDGAALKAKKLIADDRSVQTVKTDSVLAGIFNGEETEPTGKTAEIVEVSVEANPSMKLAVASTAAEEESGLKKAKRVIGVGYGVSSKEMLPQVHQLAEALDAEIGCSLPIARQLLWMDEHRVVGITHNKIAPKLYLALGVSGQPQHMSGVKDAKIVVGINIDPEAPVFKKADYGIVGDVSKLLPVLLEKAPK